MKTFGSAIAGIIVGSTIGGATDQKAKGAIIGGVVAVMFLKLYELQKKQFEEQKKKADSKKKEKTPQQKAAEQKALEEMKKMSDEEFAKKNLEADKAARGKQSDQTYYLQGIFR